MTKDSGRIFLILMGMVIIKKRKINIFIGYYVK